ncbi:cancer/testis antigen 47B-like [Cervus canadensis]|uniref:cancer/testis antigen 47B-like n=1 Tax=Cervus canadensis TaxID=1574408 RepID=UPI001CA308CD|nr:cancer/testis antigen 47B-like [Cervus canadensis]
MPEAEAGGVAGPSGGLREAAMEGWSAEEDSDIGPAEEEEEEEEEGGVGRMVDARHFPMSGFRLTFVDLVHSVLNRFYYNNHVLVRPPDGQVPVRRRTRPRLSHHSSAAMAGFPEVQVPSVGPGAGPAEEAQEAEEAEEASLWETAAEESEESSLWEMAQEPAAPAVWKTRKKTEKEERIHFSLFLDFSEAHGNVINVDFIPKFITQKATNDNI